MPDQDQPPADLLAAWVRRAGHDLRTPLAVISGMAETLQSSWDKIGEADRTRMLTSIRAQAARAVALLEDGVALAQQPTGPESSGGSDDGSQR